MSRQNSHAGKTWRRAERDWRKSDLRCWDCNFIYEDEYYMVHDEVWAAAGIQQDRILCIGCLEIRLGRRLGPADFSGFPINTLPLLPRSERLRDRMGITERGKE